MQDKSFELSTDDSGFLNFASSGLDSPSPASSGAADGGSMPPSSTSMDDHGLGSKPPSRQSSAKPGDEEGARGMSAMSSEDGPDAQSNDLDFEKPKPNEDFFKKPVENMSLEEVGNPAMMSAGAAGARVDPMSWVTLLYEYSQGTSMHGLPYITHSARFVLRRSAASSPLDYFNSLSFFLSASMTNLAIVYLFCRVLQNTQF